jgi:hypothetical protein
MNVELQNIQLPANHQDIDNLNEEEIGLLEETDNRISFRVPSSVKGIHYLVDRVKTTANTLVYKCNCLGFITNHKKEGFECRHIRLVKEFMEENK